MTRLPAALATKCVYCMCERNSRKIERGRERNREGVFVYKYACQDSYRIPVYKHMQESRLFINTCSGVRAKAAD